MNRICIILNPAARSEQARITAERVKKIARGAVIKFTEGPGDAEAKAERAVEQGYETIVAAGGDGTINEVVNGLDGAHVKLGILPIGSVNVFAMELGIPMRVDDAWDVVLDEKIKAIDLAHINDHKFVQLAGIGFDAQVVEGTAWESKKMLGPLSYALTATQVVGQKPPQLRVIRDNGPVIEGSFVLIGNGRFYGGPFEIFKHASLEDGLLDVCVFQQMNVFAALRYLQGILTGSHTTFADVKYVKARHFRVESDERVPVEVDGELLGHLPVDVGVKRGALKVIVP